MPETPPRLPQGGVHIACPHCTIQIPAGVPVCPHCRQPVLPEEGPRRPRFFEAGLPTFAIQWERHGKWIKAAGPILLALVILLLVYQRWIAYRVTVVENPSLPVQVEEERKGDVGIVRG